MNQIVNRDSSTASTQFRQDVLEGLLLPRKSLSPKYLYDERGSQLFEQICECREYYVTRTEVAILEQNSGEIAEALGRQPLVFEFGSGASRKTRILLNELNKQQGIAAYVPIDISREFLLETARSLQKEYPALKIIPMCADFTRPMLMPEYEFTHGFGKKTAFFPGSTIGNFDRIEARVFLRQTASFLGHAGLLLVGVDLIKPKAVLEPAYDDAAGITAAFNLNLLHRIRNELGGTIDPSGFRHKAFFNEKENRMEMHLEAIHEQVIELSGCRITFHSGETIHTECSYKYDPDQFAQMTRDAGFAIQRVWMDPLRFFAVYLLEAQHLSEQLPEAA
jgi:dimethylhistidine N-methyltransferase